MAKEKIEKGKKPEKPEKPEKPKQLKKSQKKYYLYEKGGFLKRKGKKIRRKREEPDEPPMYYPTESNYRMRRVKNIKRKIDGKKLKKCKPWHKWPKWKKWLVGVGIVVGTIVGTAVVVWFLTQVNKGSMPPHDLASSNISNYRRHAREWNGASSLMTSVEDLYSKTPTTSTGRIWTSTAASSDSKGNRIFTRRRNIERIRASGTVITETPLKPSWALFRPQPTSSLTTSFVTGERMPKRAKPPSLDRKDDDKKILTKRRNVEVIHASGEIITDTPPTPSWALFPPSQTSRSSS